MAENEEIKTGDVVCLKSEKNSASPRKMTVGSAFSGSQYQIHWFYQGELRVATVHQDALHKLE